MLTKSLVAAATALAASTALSLPAGAEPNNQTSGAAIFDTVDAGPRGNQFAQGCGPGPCPGQFDGRQGDGPRGDRFAEGRGPGPRHGQFEGRGRGDGPRGDQFAEGCGSGPRHGQVEGRGPGDGQHGPMMKRRGIDA